MEFSPSSPLCYPFSYRLDFPLFNPRATPWASSLLANPRGIPQADPLANSKTIPLANSWLTSG